MPDMENCRITATHFGTEDRGLMTFVLTLGGPSWSQGFGGLNLGKDVHWPAAIAALLDVVGVDAWEKLPGKLVRVRRGVGPEEMAIGHIIEDRWISLGDLLTKFRREG
jgi:hypothetical protein